MLGIRTLGPGPAAIATSLALHVGAAAGFAAHASQDAADPVDIELTSTLEARVETRPMTLPAESNRPDPVVAMPPPAPPRPARSLRGQLGPVSSARALSTSSASAPGVAADVPVRFVLPDSALAHPIPTPSPEPALPAGLEPTLAEGDVSVPARLVATAPLAYPPRARAAGVEASVAVEIVVDTRGRVVDARLLAPAGYGLDQAALQAVRSYRFSPAKHLGQPVRVRMRWSVLFRLR